MRKLVLSGIFLFILFSVNAQTKDSDLVLTVGYTNDFGVNAILGFTGLNSELSFTFRDRENLDWTLLEYRYILEPDGVFFPGDKVDFQIRGIGGIGYHQWSHAPFSDLFENDPQSNFVVLFGAGGEARFGSSNSITPIVRLNFINYIGGYYSDFSWFEPNISAGLKIRL